MKPKTLKGQFALNSFMLLIVIALISGSIQIFFIKEEISNNVQEQATMVSQDIEQGIKETNLASKSIEKQIDLKMESYSTHIADLLKGKQIDEITSNDLTKISDELGLDGITLFSRPKAGSDIVGTVSTDPKEIGFNIKKYSETGYQNFERMLQDKPPISDSYSYMTNNLMVLPISQSGSHGDTPLFFKYAYYHEPGTPYIINPYIEANDIYHFTKKVGPETWINEVKKTNKYVVELAVLDPRVYKDPSLATKIYPPLKKIVYGTFADKTKADEKALVSLADKPRKMTDTQKYHGKKLYKMFLPTSDGKVIYVALDYGKMSGPVYRHSIILIITGLISLVALFLVITRFFNRIYENIQKIKVQIKSLETGDLTAKSDVKDESELENLSSSANKMADNLNKLIKNTQNQAYKTQKLSVLLESAASESIDKMYQVSTEATMKSRDQLYEITEFNNLVEQVLQPYKDQEAVKQVLDNIDKMREIANERTSATTDVTLTLSDLLKSLHGQSSELSEISNTLLEYMGKFKL